MEGDLAKYVALMSSQGMRTAGDRKGRLTILAEARSGLGPLATTLSASDTAGDTVHRLGLSLAALLVKEEICS